MAIKNLIAGGIGFGPGSVKFIVTRGLSIGATAAVSSDGAVKVVVYAQNPATVIRGSRTTRIINDSRVPKIVKK